MSMKPALIFDLDGTLWDACVPIAEAWTIAGRKYFPSDYLVTEEMTRGLMGKTMAEIGASLSMPGMNKDELQLFMKDCFDFEVEFLKTRPGKLFPKELETLGMLKEMGFRLFIVSNCQNGYIETFTPLAPGLFEGFMCYGDTLGPKHQTIRALMERYQIDDAIYIGDTAGDEKETRLAGLPFVFASYGFGQAENPDLTIEEFSQYPILLDRFCKEFA